jgi:hypothetical protein
MSSPLGRAPEMQLFGDRDEITEMPESSMVLRLGFD